MNVSCLLFLYVDCFDCLLPRKGHRGARRPEALVPPQRERRAGDNPGGVQGRLRAHTSPLVLCYILHYIIISPDAVFVCCSLPRRGCCAVCVAGWLAQLAGWLHAAMTCVLLPELFCSPSRCVLFPELFLWSATTPNMIHSMTFRARPAAWTCRTTPRRTSSWRCGWAGAFAFDVVSGKSPPVSFLDKSSR